MPDRPTLAEFLRSRRERLSPAQAGLKDNGRRRTPGLRREEVAALSGVSIDYLVRLEQGRDVNPSSDVLLALAAALQLDAEESRHLLALATVSTTPGMERLCPPIPELDAPVAPSVLSLLDRLDPTPAMVVGPAGDVLASNTAWRALVAPLGLADGANLARHVFTGKDAYVEWGAVADAEVARLREAQLHHGDDDRFAGLIAELAELPEFVARWSGPSPAASARRALGLRHPAVGELHLDVEAMGLATDGHQLVCWLPADEAAEAVFDGLSLERPVSPARLRVVGDG